MGQAVLVKHMPADRPKIDQTIFFYHFEFKILNNFGSVLCKKLSWGRLAQMVKRSLHKIFVRGDPRFETALRIFQAQFICIICLTPIFEKMRSFTQPTTKMLLSSHVIWAKGEHSPKKLVLWRHLESGMTSYNPTLQFYKPTLATYDKTSLQLNLRGSTIVDWNRPRQWKARGQEGGQ